MNAIYTPPSGLHGKLRRYAARALDRTPLSYRLDRTLVSFSFDDVPQSAATTGAEILERFGWRGTFYAAAGFTERTTHLGAMHTDADLARLEASGHEIGCHTFAHDDAGGAPVAATLADCGRNRDRLRHGGVKAPPRTFAFPYGEARPGLKSALLKPYRALRGVRPGVNRTGADRGLLNAVPLDGGEPGLARALDYIEDAALSPGWLIFFGHDVRENPSEWGCTPAFLETVCDAVRRAGFEVDTMAGALETIEAAQ
ncbi:MAG: polysaccharide deacetylase family protein [Oceanicaulis sp.]